MAVGIHLIIVGVGAILHITVIGIVHTTEVITADGVILIHMHGGIDTVIEIPKITVTEEGGRPQLQYFTEEEAAAGHTVLQHARQQTGAVAVKDLLSPVLLQEISVLQDAGARERLPVRQI